MVGPLLKAPGLSLMARNPLADSMNNTRGTGHAIQQNQADVA
jgi:hypothetical protein